MKLWHFVISVLVGVGALCAYSMAAGGPPAIVPISPIDLQTTATNVGSAIGDILSYWLPVVIGLAFVLLAARWFMKPTRATR